MLRLWIVTFLWAFSFSLIGKFLAGKVDSYVAILIRFLLAFVVLLPFTDWKKTTTKDKGKITFIGMIQVGLMYLCFYKSFLYLPVYEVILFTIFTPLYITIISNLLSKKIYMKGLFCTFLAIIGSFIIRYKGVDSNFLTGFLLVQGANLSFGLGQVLYKKIVHIEIEDRKVFAFFFLGALLFITPVSLFFSNFDKVPTSFDQFATLLWLGIVASGVGYLLWNSGAKRVSDTTLAVMNNAVIPVGIVISFLLWPSQVEWVKLFIGGSLILIALYIEQKGPLFKKALES